MAAEKLNRDELLKDSEATLREVAGILLELWDRGGSGVSSDHEEKGNGNGKYRRLGDLVGILMTTYREIQSVLLGIREGRGILQQAAMERVKRTHQKLEEVTLTTEVAATDMLDGLDRALALVDTILPADAQDAPGDQVREVAGEQLREELHRLVILLQFQDITAQQLAHAVGVLAEVEDRLEALTRLFDLHQLDSDEELMRLAGKEKGDFSPNFDPAASTQDAESRQALADEIFTHPGGAAAS